MRLSLNNTLLITTEEKLLSIENAKTTDLIGVGMDIIDATLDREKWDEKELASAKEELDHLCHLAKYDQDSTQANFFLKSEFREEYAQFMRERHLFTKCIAYFQ
jgi:hypothetical protein